jgi:hypothetical protein
MKPVKLLCVGALALGAGLLSGCEVQKQFGAQCTTSPPVPHQNEGIVDVDVEVPPKVTPGSTFTVRVDNLVGYPALAGPGQFPSGALSITGPVTPSGTVGVGPGFFGAPYPHTLELTVTGQPGEEIRLGAVSGSSFFGTFPTNGFGATCTTIAEGGDGAEIVTIPIVEPGS